VSAGLALVEWAGRALAGGARRELFGILAPGGVLALALAAVIAGPDAGHTLLVLALATLGPALAFPVSRRWSLWGIAGAFGLAAAAVTVTAEGLRLGTRWVAVPGTMGLLVATLLAIAITEPANVQAYTLPAGLYFIGLGLTYRRSPELLGPHLLAHELALIAGVAILLLPPAEQSFAPDGGWYGLEVIGLGLALLVAGMVLGARWLVAGGVAALTAVAVRWLFTSGAVPYWLTLGLVGMALLAVGLLLLLNREWWDAARRRIARWWLDVPGGPDPTGSGA
jgi:hypothetical protein